MTLYAVTREAGPAWTDGKSAFEQPGVEEHVTFMNALSHEGTVLFAGPLAGSESGRIRVLLVAHADTEADVLRRLAADPWEDTQRVVTTSVESWNLLVGAEHLAAVHRT